MKNWNEIWSSRTGKAGAVEWSDLLRANGYDGAQSNLNVENLSAALNRYAREIRLERGDSVYEIGCGAGAFLHQWSHQGHAVGGCDLSQPLVDCAKEALPKGNWSQAAAHEFPVGGRWDHLVSFGLCLYLTPVEVEDLIVRMVMKAKRSVSIYDIPDESKQWACEEERERLIPDYKNRYAGLHHYYHSKERIAAKLAALGLSVTIKDQDIPGYENGKWRFNLFVHL